MSTSFNSDITKGQVGEKIFVEDYLIPNNINFIDVSSDDSYQKDDVDFITESEVIEVKANYNDNGWITIEEFTNVEPQLGPISPGWYSKTKATKIVFVSKKTRDMIILDWNVEFKKRYEEVKEDYCLKRNQITKYENSGKTRQGAFRTINLEEFTGMYCIYKKEEHDKMDNDKIQMISYNVENLLKHIQNDEIESNEDFNNFRKELYNKVKLIKNRIEDLKN